jgi:hypothetical protein
MMNTSMFFGWGIFQPRFTGYKEPFLKNGREQATKIFKQQSLDEHVPCLDIIIKSSRSFARCDHLF